MEQTSVPCFPCFIRTTRRSTSDGKGAIPPAATFATLSSPDEHRVAGHVVGNRAQIRKILRFGADRGRKRRAAPAAPPLLIRINPAKPNSPHQPGQVGRREAEHAVHSLIRHIGRDVSPVARPNTPSRDEMEQKGRNNRPRCRIYSSSSRASAISSVISMVWYTFCRSSSSSSLSNRRITFFASTTETAVVV